MLDEDQEVFEIESELDYYHPYLPEYKLLAAVLTRALLDLHCGDRHTAWLAVEWFEGAPSDGFNYEDIVSSLSIGMRYQIKVRAFVASAKRTLQYKPRKVIVVEFSPSGKHHSSKEMPCPDIVKIPTS